MSRSSDGGSGTVVGGGEIVLAPFSNSYIRDWPVGHWASLAGLLLDRVADDVLIRVIGTPNQRFAANEIVRDHSALRVVNACGREAWPQVVERLRAARCIVGNNSGVVHLGGFLGVPTVCVFGGSHQRREWHARGSSVVVVSRAIGCSPCQLDHGSISPYDKACLRLIEPRSVADAVLLAMAGHDDRATAAGPRATAARATEPRIAESMADELVVDGAMEAGAGERA